MIDINLFDKKVLSNGITLYTKQVDTQYSVVEVTVPVGSGHNSGSIQPGTFHFLEHICFERSQLFPVKNSFKQFLGLKSAVSNASTGHKSTSYYFSTPNQHLSSLLPGFMSSVFQPLIEDQDIQLQQTIISNERQRKARWFPGNTELGQYLSTQWMWDQYLTLEQRLGSDQDLQAMTVDSLTQAHNHYFNKNTIALYIGQTIDPQFEQLLEAIPTHNQPLPTLNRTPMSWVRQDYTTKPFRDVSRYQLYYGSFEENHTANLEDIIRTNFILTYLSNSVHGPLYQWLRHEKGWLYEINYDVSMDSFSLDWSLMLPLSSQEQVDQVRQELWSRAEQALQDTARLDLEATRAIGGQAYSFQTTSSLINAAASNLATYGRVIPQSEALAILEQCRNPHFLQPIYNRLFNPQYMGSFCATPETPDTSNINQA